MSLTTNRNFLNPNGFKLSVDRTKYPNSEYFCSSVNHPDLSVGESQMNIPKLNNFLVGDTLVYGTLTCSISLDEDMHSYTEMLNWIRSVADTHGEDTSDIKLQVLSSHNNVIKTFTYKDAFPTNITNLQFTTQTNEYLTFDVTFRYTEFELE